MKLKKFISAAAGAFMLTASAGTAATVTLHNEGSNSFGAPNWSETVTRVVTYNPNGGNSGTSQVSAGMFRLANTAMQSIIAFCIEPGSGLDLSQSFDTAAAPDISADRLSVIKKLYNTAYTAVVDASSAAAFQLAVWEIAVEDAGSAYSLTNGDHYITGWQGSTFSKAQSFLAGLNGPATGSYEFTTYTNSGQDIISVTPTPVPVPAAGLMIMTALGGLGISRLRRKS